MKILQIGYPKSGNYWLYKIIQESLDIAGIEKQNYIQQHPIYPIACTWELSYPEQVNINMMDILYPGCFFRISSIFRKRIENIQAYINGNTHIWSHSNYCAQSKKIFPLLDNIIYIIRDPRDVVLSKAEFAFTPYMKKHYPSWHKSPSQYLRAEAKNIAQSWNAHVAEYLREAERHNILILFYERFQQMFDQELGLLLNYLGFIFTARQRENIKHKVHFNRMKQRSPQHVRKARHYKWKENMPNTITKQITSITKDLLHKLNYPIIPTNQQLPAWEGRAQMIARRS